MYDAWAVYDATAVGYIHHEKRVVADPAAKCLPVDDSSSPTARIVSPRLAHPEQITDFQMEVREISDAGV